MNRKIWKALGIAVCMLALAAPRAMAETIMHTVTADTDFAKVVKNINASDVDDENVIELCADITLTVNHTLKRNTTIKSKDEDRKISIEGSNAGITVAREGTVLNLGAKGYDKKLTIEGDGAAKIQAAFVTVSEGATANMYENVTLQNRKSMGNACIVIMGSKSVFNMRGGVTENCSRAAIADSGATFHMFDGEIKDCKVNGDGVILVNGESKFIMDGGTISGCEADAGGGLYADNSTVTISGGTITEASGGYMAAGIGSGYQGLGTVTIEGDAVIKNAQGGEAGAGIGSGTYGDSEIIIRGDAVIENAESSGNGAGIGSGQGDLYPDGDGMVIDPTVGNVTIEGNAKIENAKSGYGGSGIGGGAIGIGNVIIRGNAQIRNATGGEEGAGIGGGALGTGDVTIEGNVTIENAQGGAGAAGIGGGAETEPDTEDTRNKVSIKSTEAGSPNITAAGGGVLNDENAPLAGAAAIGSGSVADGATEVKSDITVEGKVTINATGGGDVAIGDSINGETQFSGLQVGTTITRRNAKGDDISKPGDVPEPEKPAQPTVTPTEGAEAPSTGSVEVERPVTVEGLYVTNVLGKQITHTCTQNGTTLTIRANGIVTSAHLTLGMVRTLKAQDVKTLVFTTLLSRSTTVSVDALLAAEPDAPDETAVVWTHTGPRAALTIGGADHSALLK